MTIDQLIFNTIKEECPELDIPTISYLVNYAVFDCDWVFNVSSRIELLDNEARDMTSEPPQASHKAIRENVKKFCDLYKRLVSNYSEATLILLATSMFMVTSTSRTYKSCTNIPNSIQYLRLQKGRNESADFSWRVGAKPGKCVDCLKVINSFAGYPGIELITYDKFEAA